MTEGRGIPLRRLRPLACQRETLPTHGTCLAQGGERALVPLRANTRKYR
jgi:hypothetical protein